MSIPTRLPDVRVPPSMGDWIEVELRGANGETYLVNVEAENALAGVKAAEDAAEAAGIDAGMTEWRPI